MDGNVGEKVASMPAQVEGDLPRLMRVTEVDTECAEGSSHAELLRWLREFIAKPHPHLGRSGSICPFVPMSLELDTIWIAEVNDERPDFDRVCEIIGAYRNVFLETEPKSFPGAINKAFLVTFPSLARLGPEGTALVDKVQHRLKPYFVDSGLMLGEFHATNESPGLRNSDFRPLRSPIPMLAIRNMVESDLPFMTRQNYSAKERSAFLRSYLFRLGGALRVGKFNEALERLIADETVLTLENMLTRVREKEQHAAN